MAEKYVVPKLMGGLGNQLHMISAAMDVALRTNRTLIFNYISHNTHSPEPRSLCDLFPEVPVRSDIQVVNDYPGETFTYKDIVPHINHEDTCISISGYNQHPKYIPEGFCKFIDTIPDRHPYVNMTDTAFIHFRRKDYVGHPFYEINMDVYYTTAVKSLLSTNPNVKLLVVSDDTEWSYQYITNLLSGIMNRDNILVLGPEYNATESLKIMANCLGGAICANSSFSWWGAYINRNRPIFMPNPWITLDENPNLGLFFEGVTKVFWKSGNIEPELQPQIPSDTIVSANLRGGIGNWIFIILAALGYAEKYSKQFILIRNNIIEEGNAHTRGILDKILKIFPNLPIIDSVPNLLTIQEITEFKYYPLENYNSNVILNGYFQNEQYFFSESLIPTIKTSYYSDIYFVHIRAGDYIGNPRHYVDLVQYYKNCFSLLDSNLKYIVFSDDNQYADNYMKQFGVSYMISDKVDQVDTLIEMANCAGGICANSSFSWLGALFQGPTRGQIFMPSIWINGNEDYSGVYPKWATIVDCSISNILHGNIECKIYDVFIKRGIIYVISTFVTDNDPNVTVRVNNIILREYSRNEGEPMRYFCGPVPDTEYITITVNNILHKRYDKKDIELVIPLEKKNKLAYATLFKDDYPFLQNMIDHYRKQGVDYFYLYYNGSELPENIPRGPDICYKTWDIHPYYWSHHIWLHNSQTSFLAMFHQKYFDDNEWVILADLDEIIINYSGGKIKDILDITESQVIKVRNHWGILEGDKIVYSSDSLGGIHRVKCIYRGSFREWISVHRPRKGEEVECFNLRMLHLTNVLHHDRIEQVVHPLEFFNLS